jgi:MoaA/NifB/PqqE/SkfB family radical SAM enzyme
MFTIDIEVTNRCNADCYFCPRDQTPHEGLMTPEVFQRALARATEYRTDIAATGEESGVQISLCGLGEPLINPRLPEWIRAVKDAGFNCTISSNGALLDERRATAILDAGVDQIMINVGDIGEAYESVYKLPWQRTHDNIVRFAEMAKDRCEVFIVLVNYKQDAAHTEAMKEFWRERGLSLFVEYDIINRGGSLFVDHMQFEALPELATARTLISEEGGRSLCATPFVYLFIGYDGNYYLCCSDWKKEVPLGTVFETSLLGVTRRKYEYVASRGSVCRTCNLDPVNYLVEQLQAAEADPGAVDGPSEARQIVKLSREIEQVLERLQPKVTENPPPEDPPRRQLIPVIGS